MKRLLKAEMLKLITTRAMLALLLGEIGVVLLTTTSTVASAQPEALIGSVHDQVFFLLVSINVGIFSLIVGIRAVTDEFRHATIVHSFLSDPSRRGVVAAKAISAAVVAAALAALSLVVMVTVAIPLASMKDGALTLAGSDWRAFAGNVAAHALWAVIGVGVGFIVRNQVPAMVGAIVWVLVIENLGSGFLGDAGAYLPGQAAYALGGALETPQVLAVATAGAVMGLYAVALFVVGLGVTRRRDVA